MFKNVYAVGFMIFTVIMIAFFITNTFFRNVDYYQNSIMMTAFFVPFVFGVGAFLSVTTYSRWKKVLTFKEAFGRAFLPMFFGGILSVATMFAYINYVDTDTKDLLNHQFIESYRNSLEDEYAKAKQITKPDSKEMEELNAKYEQGKVRIAEKVKKKEDMFSAQYFAYVFAGFCLYFIVLSTFFGSFFRTRTNV